MAEYRVLASHPTNGGAALNIDFEDIETSLPRTELLTAIVAAVEAIPGTSVVSVIRTYTQSDDITGDVS